MTLNRRQFLGATLGASGAMLLGGQFGRALARTGPALTAADLPVPGGSGIEHVVVVMMENRSFDHFLGWLPNANGKQAGLTYLDSHGKATPTWHATRPDGCDFADPDHGFKGGRTQYAGGKMDGFLADPNYDRFAVSYYTEADRPFMAALARNYTTCDSYFCSILGPTYPNRFFQHAAATDRLSNSMTTSTLPTIWDRLNQSGGPTGRYYFNDLPFLGLWGPKYLPISAPYQQFLSDASGGTLPNVAYVDPRFLGEGQGVSNDDHPAADIRAGDALLSEIFNAVSSGPGWAKTVLVINYDEWGGFYDHVAPPRVTPGVAGVDTDPDAAGKVLLGFRVPCIVASPFARGASPESPTVSHGLFDHTSVLKLIEWRWGLAPLSARDASTAPTDPGNLATALDFAHPNTNVPSLPTVSAPPPAPCLPGSPSAAAADATWGPLIASGKLRPWGVSVPVG